VNRQRLGWAMVGLAAVLLLAQLVPVLAAGRGPTALSSSQASLRHGPGPLGAEFRARRLAPTEESLVIDRTGNHTNFEVVGWQGSHDGTLDAPKLVNPADTGWGYLQSFDGSRFLAGTRYLDIDGRSSDLTYLVEYGRLTSFMWRDDSQGACALTDDGAGTGSLVQFVFNPGHASEVRFRLTSEFAADGRPPPTVLWCSRAQRTAAVGVVADDGTALVEILDIANGAELGRRAYRGGSASSLVASGDGKLLAVNGGSLPGSTGPAAHTVVRDINTDRVLLDLGTDTIVRSFSNDGSRVLVDSPSRPATAIVKVADGSTLWTDNTGRELLGWLARPVSPEFAVALGRLDPRTCTRGEPLKFPQFCRFEALQDLEVISETGAVRAVGRGIGAWGYTVR
jgi:hypothetical protein